MRSVPVTDRLPVTDAIKGSAEARASSDHRNPFVFETCTGRTVGCGQSASTPCAE